MKNRVFTTVLFVICLMGLAVGSADAQEGGYTLVMLGGSHSFATHINNQGQVIGGNNEYGYFLWENGMMMSLGTLGGEDTNPSALNDKGQVVGFSETAPGRAHAFLWENGVMTDLHPGYGLNSWASDINEKGQIVGGYQSSTGPRSFIWSNGNLIDLNIDGSSTAQRINDQGQIIGRFSSPLDPYLSHIYFWENGVMTDLGTLGGTYIYARGLNGKGQVVGTSQTTTGKWHAFLWENGVMTDLGTLGGSSSGAVDINEKGQIAGLAATASGSDHAFLWENGIMHDLGTLGVGAGVFDINESGQIVGEIYMSDEDPNDTHAALWRDGVIIDLGNQEGWWCSWAVSINDLGQVAGSALTADGWKGIIWIPQTTIPIAIDIKPGSSTNPINLGAKGVIPVAVLTTPEFNALDLDPATVLFAGATPVKWSKQDVDDDGAMDLLFHFDVQKLALTSSSVEASLTGKTFDGKQAEGKDTVRIVPVTVSYP